MYFINQISSIIPDIIKKILDTNRTTVDFSFLHTIMLSSELIKGLEKKGFNFTSADQITDEISKLMSDLNDENRGKIYDLNDTLEKHLKATKKEVQIAKQQEIKK